MIRVHHGALTRSVRIVWLLEELGVPYEVVTVPFVPPARPFSQQTPSGKFPVLEDGDAVISESGAIVEYLIERYGAGRLAPPPGTALRGSYLQWLHFAEATFFSPLGQIAQHTLFKPEGDRIEAVAEEGRRNAALMLDVVERGLGDREFLPGPTLSGADVMMGYTLQVARLLGVLDERHPRTLAYLGRLLERPGFQKALAG
jgi:glutathione S-transferase